MSATVNVAIVTGGVQGIGKCIANCLLSLGYQVFLFDIKSSCGEKTAKELQQKYGDSMVSFVFCDVSDKLQLIENFNRVVKQCGHISVMVNNAGTVDEFNYERCIEINLLAEIHGSNLAIDHMRKDKGGYGGIIINTASVAAFGSYYFIPAYCATKSGILNFTKSWSKNPRCQELGLTFMCLCPGYVDTELTKNAGDRTLDKEEFEDTKVQFENIRFEIVEQSFHKLFTDKQNGSVMEITPTGPRYLIEPNIAGVSPVVNVTD